MNHRYIYRLATVLLILLPAGALPAAPSCADLCAAMAPLQSYGADDPTCLAVCGGAQHPCKQEWDAFLQCAKSGSDPEACRTAYSGARNCSVCQQGDVDLEGLETAIFVNNRHYVNNQLICSQNVQQGGTAALPYCDFSLGIDKALERQADDRSTKVVVCPGTYFESHDDAINALAGSTTSTAPVIVESVVRHEAVVTGSEDWKDAWMPVAVPVTEVHHNEFLRSIEPADASVWWRWNLDPVTPLSTPLPPIPAPGQVRYFVPTATAGEHYVVQALTPLGGRRVTFSLYLYPQGVDRFRLVLLHDDANPAQVGYTQGAWFDFELPQGGPCGFERRSKDAAVHVEPVGTTGWYRLALTETFDTDPDPTTGLAPMLTGARLSLLSPHGDLVWSGENQAGVFVFGPQLDHRPLDEFSTTPRDYVWTDATAESDPVPVVKNLWVTNPAVKTWPHDWGLAKHNDWGDLLPIVRRSEMVFVEGQKLRQELSIADLSPGSFFVDDGISYAGTNYVEQHGMVAGTCSEQQPCSIYVDPPPGIDMAGAEVEVARSPRLLWMNPVRHWEFRGLVFRHATGAYDKSAGGDAIEARLQSAVAFSNAAELTLLENRFEWNSAFGLGVSGTVARHLPVSSDSNVRLIRNSVVHNGIGGQFLGGCQNCEVTEDDYSYNNWSGAQGGFSGHTTAGAKLAANIATTVRSLAVRENAATGLWLDYENQQVQILEATVKDNFGTGVYFEANDEWCSPVANTTNYLIDSSIVGNAIGVRLIGSRGTRLSFNDLVDNAVGLSLIGDPYEGIDKTCYPTPPHTTPPKWLRDLYVDNNFFSAACPGDRWIHYSDQAGNLSRWQPVMLSLSSWSNTYTHVEGLGTPAIEIWGELLTLDDWKSCDPALPSAPAWCFESQDQGSVEQ